MSYRCFVRFITFWMLFTFAAVADSQVKQKIMSTGYIRQKIERFQVDVKFEADPNLSSPAYIVGSTTMQKSPAKFVLLIGSKSDTPLRECREIYVEESVFLSAKVGGRYPPKIKPAEVSHTSGR